MDRELGRKALALLDEIAAKQKCSRTSACKASMVGTVAQALLAKGEGCTEQTYARIAEYHARVTGSAAPLAEDDDEGEVDDEGAGDVLSEDAAAPAPKAARTKPAPKAKAARTKPAPKAKPARTKPAPKAKPARRVPARAPARTQPARPQAPAPVESELTRAARVIERLGGIDRAERLTSAIVEVFS